MSSKRTEAPIQDLVSLEDDFKSKEKSLKVTLWGAKKCGKTTLKNNLIEAKKNDNSPDGIYNFAINEVEMNMAEFSISKNEKFQPKFKVKCHILLVLIDLTTVQDHKVINAIKKKIDRDNMNNIVRYIGTKSDLAFLNEPSDKKQQKARKKIQDLFNITLNDTPSHDRLAEFLNNAIIAYDISKKETAKIHWAGL